MEGNRDAVGDISRKHVFSFPIIHKILSISWESWQMLLFAYLRCSQALGGLLKFVLLQLTEKFIVRAITLTSLAVSVPFHWQPSFGPVVTSS